MSNGTTGVKKPKRRDLSPQQKAELEARKASGNIFLQDMSFFVLNQVSVIQDGDFQINVLVEGGRITSFDFSMNGKRLYRPFESEENEDA